MRILWQGMVGGDAYMRNLDGFGGIEDMLQILIVIYILEMKK